MNGYGIAQDVNNTIGTCLSIHGCLKAVHHPGLSTGNINGAGSHALLIDGGMKQNTPAPTTAARTMGIIAVSARTAGSNKRHRGGEPAYVDDDCTTGTSATCAVVAGPAHDSIAAGNANGTRSTQ